MSSQTQRVGLILTTLFLFPALACGLMAEATPTPLPTAAPSSTPLPSTATTTPVETFVDYELSDQGLTFRYPQSWEVEPDNNTVAVASDAQLLTAQEFDTEGAGVLIVVGPVASFEGDTLEDALLAAVEGIDFTTNDRIIEGPTATTINGQQASRATIEGSAAGGDQTLVIHVALVRSADRAAFVTAVTLQTLADQYAETLETLIQSVSLQSLASADSMSPQGSLEYGQTVEGQVQAGASSGWTFIGVKGERIDVTVRPLQDDLDVTVDVHNVEGTSILPAGPVDDSFGTETIRGLSLPDSAQYTVVVSGFAEVSGPFELAIAEAGSLTSGQSIAIGDALNGSLELDDQDDYLFESVAREPIMVTVNPDGELDVVLEVIDDEGAIIYQEDRSYGQEQLSFTPDEGAQYILRVRGFAGASGDYTINLVAGGVGSTGSTLVVSDSVDAGDEEGDDYPFTLDEGEIVRAIVDPDDEFDVVVEVWNDDSDTLEESVDASFGREEVNFTAGQAGDYYFKVLGFEDQGGSYTITLNGPPGAIFELIAGDRVTADLGQSTVIEYYVRMEPGETVQISVEPDADTDIVAELLTLDAGNPLASADEGFSGESEQIAFTAPAADGESGIYLLRISNFSGEPGGTFALSLE